jgi:transcriptional regulator with XRE-family HTH domain
VKLGEYMDARRKELGLRWEELATRVGATSSYLRAIRAGRRRPSDIATSRIEAALRWAPGSIDAILDSAGEPTPIDGTGGSRMDWRELAPPATELEVIIGHWGQLSEFSRQFILRAFRDALEELGDYPEGNGDDEDPDDPGDEARPTR